MLGELGRRAQTWVMPLALSFGLRRRLRLLADRQARHRSITDPSAMERWQLSAFNEIWRRAGQRYRFYRDWRRIHRLPEQLSKIDELREFPVLRSTDIQESLAGIVEDAAPCQLVFTGGSSGQTRLFPRGSEDADLLYASMYLGRSWSNISPGDGIVAIWGHEHLFGAGALGRLRKAKRQVMDWLIGTCRLSVYRLDDDTVGSYFEAILARPGAILIGYSSAIRKVLDFVERSSVDGRSAGIRVVIFCSEPVAPGDFDRVRRLLASSPVVEYGMQETGVMAYSRPNSTDLTFFWDAFHCWTTAERELVVTTLQPVRFPLINYGTEDTIELLRGASAMLPFRCARVTGRTREILSLTLRGGRTIDVHSEVIEDVLDVLSPRIRSYMIHQRADIIDIAIKTAQGQELSTIRDLFFQEIKREFPEIDETKVTFSALDSERLTIAGKRRSVVRE